MQTILILSNFDNSDIDSDGAHGAPYKIVALCWLVLVLTQVQNTGKSALAWCRNFCLACSYSG